MGPYVYSGLYNCGDGRMLVLSAISLVSPVSPHRRAWTRTPRRSGAAFRAAITATFGTAGGGRLRFVCRRYGSRELLRHGMADTKQNSYDWDRGHDLDHGDDSCAAIFRF